MATAAVTAPATATPAICALVRTGSGVAADVLALGAPVADAEAEFEIDVVKKFVAEEEDEKAPVYEIGDPDSMIDDIMGVPGAVTILVCMAVGTPVAPLASIVVDELEAGREEDGEDV